MRALAACALVLFGCAQEAETKNAEPQPVAAFEAANGEVTVRLEVADAPEERARGLMYRKELAGDAGMIFVFPSSEEHGFWMKNTFVSLDMIFVGEDLKVAGVAADTEPLSEETVTVGKPSKYVIEVVAGFCAKHGIAAGTTVRLTDVPLNAAR